MLSFRAAREVLDFFHATSGGAQELRATLHYAHEYTECRRESHTR
jgi:hypothetical protein